jgi:hypothetical protein
MPLPTGGAWPPAPLAPVFDKLAVWSTWYAGDPAELSALYGGQTGAGDSTQTGFFASQQGGFRAKVRERLQRYFWGQATPTTEQRTKLHVPIAGDIAATSADLLFSEPPSITVEGDDATQARLAELIDDGIYAALIEAAEIGAALGGVYLRVCWDTDVQEDRPWLAPVHADAAVPEWSYGKLTAVTFWRVLADDGKIVVRHLERHEPGKILHGVYVGDRDELGRQVALTDFPETAALAELITGDGDTIATGIKSLTACYIPNMRPNRLWRTSPAAAYYGRSDFQGLEPLFDALDEVYSSWMRDIRLGKARLVVPETFLQSEGRGKGSRIELERELYEGVNALGAVGQMQLEQVQFKIRYEEHQQSAQHLLEQIIRAAGYSTQTFGEVSLERGAMTATEISARERKSLITRDKKINYWRPALADILFALMEIDATVFHSGITPERPDIEFGDGVSEDPQALAQTAQLLRAAEAASTATLVAMVHPDWEDDQVQEEVAAIEAEQSAAMSVPGLDGMGSGPGASPDGPMDPNADPAAYGG